MLGRKIIGITAISKQFRVSEATIMLWRIQLNFPMKLVKLQWVAYESDLAEFRKCLKEGKFYESKKPAKQNKTSEKK